MMRQYLEIKKQYPDSILFFRMGDFYEMFLEDAERAAPLMDIALTRRQNAVPMAGVPYHSVDTYIARLIGAGEKVAIAEQEADPENPKLMRRAIHRIVTPGTVVEDSLLQSASHNYLMSLCPDGERTGVALADVSTGDFFTMELVDESESGENTERLIRDLYFRYGPREVLAPADEVARLRDILTEAARSITPLEDWKASPTEGERRIADRYGANLKGLGYDEKGMPALGAASLILHYVATNFPGRVIELNPPVFRKTGDAFMLLDEQTIRNLDLTHNQQEGGQTRTLFGVLNHCRTAAGKRRLKDVILAPLLRKSDIEARRDRTAFLVERPRELDRLTEILNQVFDLERILGRMASGRGAPRDFLALRDTTRSTRELQAYFKESKYPTDFVDYARVPDTAAKLAAEIESTIVEEPPAIAGNGPILRDGVDEELDRAREAAENGAKWVVEFEAAERKRTGISSLRVKYNRVVGYFIEISKGQADNAPPEYTRKQTLVGNERYGSEKLAELEEKVTKADEIIQRIELKAFQDLCDRIVTARGEIQAMMRGLAELDMHCAFARAAARHGWCKPSIVESGELVIEDGRHPVVEAFLEPGEQFIPNSVSMDAMDESFAVLTGPNMAGKSTYIRQIALIQLLAQIGSYVPARHATLSVVDRIFTRIGASDNLTRGESTFFVEMLETARILNQATENSLVIMDEVGRGTSTYDGLSIAWAVVEYFTGDDEQKPRVLFATHYHELTALEARRGVYNLTMDVRETAGKVVFLHKIRRGPADRSYGVHVAELAGLPPEVTARAREKLAELEEDYCKQKSKPQTPASRPRRPKTSANEKETASTNQGLLF